MARLCFGESLGFVVSKFNEPGGWSRRSRNSRGQDALRFGVPPAGRDAESRSRL